MFVLRIGRREVVKGFHNGPVLNEESPHVPGSSAASLLSSNEEDSFSGPRILRPLVIFIGIRSRDLHEVVPVSVTIGVNGVHFKKCCTTAVLGMPRKHNTTGR